MSDWGEFALGEIIKLQYGKDHKTLSDGNVPCFGSGGIMRYVNDALYDEESILIPRKGTLNNIIYQNNPFWTVDTMFWSKIDSKKALPKFLYYQLLLCDFINLNVGSAVPSLTIPVINAIKIALPPLEEQKAIAGVLSSLDDKIDLLHKQNKTLEAMTETLFRQWFIEEVEDDWEVKILDDVLSVKGGSTPSTANPLFWDGDINWTAPRDITKLNSLYLFETERKITRKGLEKISSGILPIGTLLMTSRAPVGVLAFSEIPLAINQGYIAIIDNKGIPKEYLYLWLKCNMDYVHSYANGSTFEEISKSAFKTLEISVPPKMKIQKFYELAYPLFEKIKNNTRHIYAIEKLKESLLPKLMSGEVRVDY